MSLFKKDRTKEEQKNPETAAGRSPAAKPDVLPDSEELAASKRHAEEQIKVLEGKIQNQRELWSTRLKEREEERISLGAQLEMLVRKTQNEREKRDGELSLLEQQVRRDLTEAQISLETEIKSWTERLSVKDKEIEQTKQETELLETRNKIENDQSIRGLRSELEQIEQAYKSLERKMLEEQNGWIGKIKSKEEEIIGLRTQISLKESQIAIDDEKDLTLKKEKEAAWQSQVRELEEKLKNQGSGLEKEYKKKQEELLALRSALETRLSAITFEAEKKQKEARGLIAKTGDRIKIINGHIDEEKKHWQASLKERDEEFNKLKVELMLRESQEKTERENKFQEIREAESLANRKVKEIRQKINDEKEGWKTKLDAEEEELKLFRIQAELKLKEIQGMWESRKAKAQEEKANLEKSLAEIGDSFEQEKGRLKKELEEKTAELEAYRQQWQNKLAETAAANELSLEDLRSRKGALENELNALQENLKSEKAKWEDLVLQKEREAGAIRNELKNREFSALRDLEIVDMQFKKEQQPLVDKVRDMERRFDDHKKLAQAELERREAAKTVLEEQYAARQDSLLRRFNTQAEKLKTAEAENLGNIKVIKGAIEEQSRAALIKINALKAEEDEIRSRLSSQDKRMEGEKERLEAQYKNRHKLLAESAQKLEKEQAQLREKLNVELENKTRAAEEIRTSLQEKEKQTQGELKEKEEELAAIRERSDGELARLTELLRKNNEEYDREIKTHRFSIEALEKSLKEKNAQFQDELKSVRSEWEKKLQPLSETLVQLEARGAASKKEAEEKAAAIENGIEAAREQYKRQEEGHASKIILENSRIEVAKEKLSRDAAALNLQIETHSRQTRETLERHTLRQKALENNIALEEQRLQSERQRITHYYESQQDQLSEAISKLEKEYSDYTKEADAEIRSKNAELAQEDKSLRELQDGYRRELKHKEFEFAALEDENRKKLSALSVDMDRTRSECGQKIKSKEELMETLVKTLEENKLEYDKQIEALKVNLAKELEPVTKRRLELKAEYDRERKAAEEKLASASGRIQALKAEQSSKAAEYEKASEELAASMAAAKNNFDTQVKALLDEKAALEKAAADLVASKESQISAVETEMRLKKEAIEAQKEKLKAQAGALEAALKEETALLEKETARLEKEYPHVLLEREKEISSLTARIEQKAAENREKLGQAEKSAENYQRRAERRITQIKSQIIEAQENHKKELEAGEARLGNIRVEIAKKEKNYQDELLAEGKIFSEQKYLLEKQKAELEEKFKDLQMHSRDQIRQKEKEVLILQAELAEKEKAWEESWKQKEQELAMEKNSLVQDLETLDAKLKDEEETVKKKVSEKEREIQAQENTYYNQLDSMTAEIASKKHAWEETNSRLRNEVDELKNGFSTLEKNWEAAKTDKEKELSVLKSNLEFWELRSKSEEEKRLAAWDEEKSGLETQIRDAENRLATLKKDYTAKYEEKDNALREMKIRAEENEKEKTEEVRKLEESFAAARSALQSEITNWDKKLKEETARTEKEKKEIDRDLERLKLESALKDNAAMTEQQKSERKWRKLQRELEEQLGDIERQFADEKENLKSRLSIKAEEISTLNVRMTLREDRRLAEAKHRQEEVQKVISALEAEQKSIEDKCSRNDGALGEALKRSRAELDTMKTESAAREEKWQKERDEKENAASSAYAAIMKDLQEVENGLKQENDRLEKMLEVKEKQIASLTQQMKAKEESLVTERDFSQLLLQSLQKKAGDLRALQQRTQKSGKDDEGENVTRLFESAIEHYNGGDYASAKEALSSVLKTNPEFAGAYQYLALCSWNTGEKEQAKRLARRALELEPHNEELKQWVEYIEREK